MFISPQLLCVMEASQVRGDLTCILSWRQRKLPVLSNIKEASVKQNNRLITEERRREACFLTGLTSFSDVSHYGCTECVSFAYKRSGR